MWFVLALASSIFAALTSILAKIGIDGVNSNLATAIRTVVVLILSWGHGVPHRCPGRDLGDIQKKLGVSDPIRPCDRCLLAVLLQGPSVGRCFQGCSH